MKNMSCSHCLYRNFRTVSLVHHPTGTVVPSQLLITFCLLSNIPCTEGNGWKTQKFHSMTYFPASIAKFGSPRNTDTACMEKNHKLNAKGPAFTAQKRVASFLPQSAERICDHLSIRRACRRFGISKVQVFRDDEDDEIWGEDVHRADEEPSQPKKHRTAGAPRNKFVGLKLKLVSV